MDRHKGCNMLRVFGVDASTPPEIYTCEHCGYSCERKSKLNRHYARAHVAEYGIPAGIRPVVHEETQGEPKKEKVENEDDDNKLAAGFAMEAMQKAKESKEEKGGRYCMQCRQLRWPSGRKVFRNVQDLAFHILTKHVWPTEKETPDCGIQGLSPGSGPSVRERSLKQIGSFTNRSRVSKSNEELRTEEEMAKQARAQRYDDGLKASNQSYANSSLPREGSTVESRHPARSMPNGAPQNAAHSQFPTTPSHVAPMRTYGVGAEANVAHPYPVPYPVYYVPVNANGYPMFPYPPQKPNTQMKRPSSMALSDNDLQEQLGADDDDMPLVARKDELSELRRKALNILAPSPRPRLVVSASKVPKKERTRPLKKKKKKKDKATRNTSKLPQRIPTRPKKASTGTSRTHAVQHGRSRVTPAARGNSARVTRGPGQPSKLPKRYESPPPHEGLCDKFAISESPGNNVSREKNKGNIRTGGAFGNTYSRKALKREYLKVGEGTDKNLGRTPVLLDATFPKVEPMTFNFKRSRSPNPTNEEIENVAKRMKREIHIKTEVQVPLAIPRKEMPSLGSDMTQPMKKESGNVGIKEEAHISQCLSTDNSRRLQRGLHSASNGNIRLEKEENLTVSHLPGVPHVQAKMETELSNPQVVNAAAAPLSSSQKPPVPSRMKVKKSPRASMAEVCNQQATSQNVERRKALKASMAALESQAQPVALDLSLGLGGFKRRQRKRVKTEAIVLD